MPRKATTTNKSGRKPSTHRRAEPESATASEEEDANETEIEKVERDLAEAQRKLLVLRAQAKIDKDIAKLQAERAAVAVGTLSATELLERIDSGARPLTSSPTAKNDRKDKKDKKKRKKPDTSESESETDTDDTEVSSSEDGFEDSNSSDSESSNNGERAAKKSKKDKKAKKAEKGKKVDIQKNHCPLEPLRAHAAGRGQERDENTPHRNEETAQAQAAVRRRDQGLRHAAPARHGKLRG